MEMLLIGACLTLAGLAVSYLAFGGRTRNWEPAASARQPDLMKVPAPERFFFDRAETPAADHAQIPLHALLAQIENHVRLEQAAAESFLESPSSALLHSGTISPLVN